MFNHICCTPSGLHDTNRTLVGKSRPQKDCRPLRILSLDGGGIRGLSELIILDKIFNAVNFRLDCKNVAPPRPCDYFDLICGTSTGGVIALLLGRLQMVIRL